MRILQVTPGYYPVMGGVERHVQDISEALTEHGHEVVVATVAQDRYLPRHEVVVGVTIQRFHALGAYPFLFPVGLFRYLHEQARHFDIVHAHNFHALPQLLAGLACPQRTVITPYYHGHGHTHLTDALHQIYDPFAMAAVRRMNRIICLSPSEADLVARDFQIARSKISVVPSITTVSAFHPEAVVGQKPRTADQTRLILSVGRLDTYKRIDRLIHALAYLPTELELAVVGTGPEHDGLEQLANRLGVRDRVRFLGRVGDEELQSWYRRADIVVSLSTSESFGRVVVEALAAGCFVVGSDIPAFRDFAAEFPEAVALVAPATAPQDVAAAVRTMSERQQTNISLHRYMRQTILDDQERVYMNITTTKQLPRHSLSQKESIAHENSARI
jgi:glycosyltransferase involved in cell wall biosynthesis